MWASHLIMPSSSSLLSSSSASSSLFSSSSWLELVTGLLVVGSTVVGAAVVNAGTFCCIGVEADGLRQEREARSQVVPLGQQCS